MSQKIYTPAISDVEEHIVDREATIIIEPLLPGYGMTLGNSLRRVLLSSISGAAVVAFKIEGASHEFTTVEGVKEDIVQIMLNLKGLRFKTLRNEDEDSEAVNQGRDFVTLKLQKNEAGAVLGKDIQPHPDLEILNPDHLIATLDAASSQIEIEILVGFGLGYLSIEESEALYAQNDYICLDALFSPVLRVRYKLENKRVGHMTNLDKLYLTIETDGGITPKDAFEEAAAILKEHYQTLAGGTQIETKTFQETIEEEDSKKENLKVDARLEIAIEDLQLSARTTNALVNNELYKVQDVIHLSDAELKELKGFGVIALNELKEKMKGLGF